MFRLPARTLLALILLLVPLLAEAQTPARARLRVDDESDTTQTLTIYGGARSDLGIPVGAYLRAVQVDVTGAASTVTWTLEHRLCATVSGTEECGAWSSPVLSSGSIAGAASPPGTATIELDKPRDQYRLTLTVTVGTPTAIRVYALYHL